MINLYQKLSKNYLGRLFIRCYARFLVILSSRYLDKANELRTRYTAPRETELEQLEVLLNLLHVNRNGVAIDVGANYGCWTIELKNRFRDVVAIEANPILADRLIQEGFNVRKMAASDHKGSIDLWIPSTTSGVLYGWASVDPKNCPEAISIQSVHIPCEKLDDVVGDLSIKFMKIDVEGHELGVLKGSEMILRKDRPVLICEVKPSNLDAVSAFLTEMNYSMHQSCDLLGSSASIEMYIAVPSQIQIKLQDQISRSN